MCKELSNSVVQIFTPMSNINDVWSFFRDGCQRIIEDNVPSRTTSQRFTQPWINRDVRRITRLKRRWFRRARRSKHPNDWLRYKALKKQAQKTCRETHDKYTNDMLTNDNKNPKRFCNFIKSRKKDSTRVPPFEERRTYLLRQSQQGQHHGRPVLLSLHPRRYIRITRSWTKPNSQLILKEFKSC